MIGDLSKALRRRIDEVVNGGTNKNNQLVRRSARDKADDVPKDKADDVPKDKAGPHPREKTPALRPEAKYNGSKKHGIKWTEGPATAKSTGIPQGQWGSKADLEFAGEKASTLQPGAHDWFELPSGHNSVVHRPDGTTVPATKIFVRNNGTGTFHGFPAE
jgi:hypothetical protein